MKQFLREDEELDRIGVDGSKYSFYFNVLLIVNCISVLFVLH